MNELLNRLGFHRENLPDRAATDWNGRSRYLNECLDTRSEVIIAGHARSSIAARRWFIPPMLAQTRYELANVANVRIMNSARPQQSINEPSFGLCERSTTMNKNPAPTMAQLSERITELEVLFTHLQKTIQELNQVILQQGRQADRLAEKLSQLTADYQTSASGPPAERNLLEERPPHY